MKSIYKKILNCLFLIALFISFLFLDKIYAKNYVSHEDSYLFRNKNVGEQYNLYNPNFATKNRDGGKSECESNTEEFWGAGDCQEEQDQNGYKYYSLKPAFNSLIKRHEQDAPEGGKYYYIAVPATLNKCNSGTCHTSETSITNPRKDISNQLKWAGYFSEEQLGDYTIEDIYSLKWSAEEAGWYFESTINGTNLLSEARDGQDFSVDSFFTSTIGTVESASDQQYAADFWLRGTAGIFPSTATLHDDGSVTVSQSLYTLGNPRQGINIHSKHDSADYSTRIWMVYVAKIHIDVPTTNECKIIDGKYYGINGVEITTDINYPWYEEHLSDYDNDEENYKQSVFVDMCLCNTTNGTKNSANKKPTYSDELYNSLGNIAKNYFDDYCKSPDTPPPGGVDHDCTPSIKNVDCQSEADYCETDNGTCLYNTENYNDSEVNENNRDGKMNTFTIGDDFSCVFNTQNVGGNTFSSSEHDDASNYTYKFNKYCSLTCAEQVNFTLPLNETVTAGRYWSWTQDKVTLNGIRKCQATINYDSNKDSFQEDLGINKYGQVEQFSDKSIFEKIYKDGNEITGDIPLISSDQKYGLVWQLNDLKDAYDEYSNPSSDSNKRYSHEHQHCEVNEDGSESCYPVTSFCTEYKFVSNVTGEEFLRYTEGCHNACHFANIEIPNFCDTITGCTGIFTSPKSGKTIENSKSVFRNMYKSKYNEVQDAIADVNACATKLIEVANTTKYDFRPTARFSYDDIYYQDAEFSKYDAVGTSISDGSADVTLNDPNVFRIGTDKKPTEDEIGDINENPYYINMLQDGNINGASSSYEFYSSNQNHDLIWKAGRQYMLPPHFYAIHSDINKGILKSKNTSDINNITETYYGQIFPVSLSTPEMLNGEHYDYNIAFKRLGVYKNGQTNSTSGRFDKMNGNVLNYACYYDVENDVTDPKKPEFFFRNISLNNFDPNKRELGKNWTTDKGKATICEINPEPNITVGGSALNCRDYSSIISANEIPESSYDKEPQYHFKLTPINMAEIKKYNKSKENYEGYSDFNVELYNASAVDNYNSSNQSWWYTSKFISEATDKNYADEVEYTNGRKFTAWPTYSVGSGTGPAWK